jgi:hypothetical protein
MTDKEDNLIIIKGILEWIIGRIKNENIADE